MSDSETVRLAVVGGGITGLAAAAWLEHDHGVEDVLVLEGANRPGGKIRTELDHGHVVEWGPQGFLDNASDTFELIRLAGLENALVSADNGSAARFILRGGRLRTVPTSPVAFAASDLLSLGGRLRVFGEAFARHRPAGDETVFDFARRRIGREAAEILVDSMVTGVFAGDSRTLSLAATFPRMAAMEAEHGSLTRALIARMWNARRTGGSSGPAGPGGTLHTLGEGMEQLPRQLAERLGDRLRLATTVHRLVADGAGHRLETDRGVVRADRVLLTLSAAGAAQLLGAVAPDAVAPLCTIPTVPIAVVMASYREAGAFGAPVEGFGFLVPRTENAGILGTLYCHSIFPGQGPAGSVFLRTMIGGAREPDRASLDDDELLGSVRTAHARIFGRDPAPDRVWIARWTEGISQYPVGHLDRVAAAEAAARSAGVEIAGSPYRGVSVNDCIRQARAAARRLARPGS